MSNSALLNPTFNSILIPSQPTLLDSLKCKQFPESSSGPLVFTQLNPQNVTVASSLRASCQLPVHNRSSLPISLFAHGYLSLTPSCRLTHLTQPFRIPYFLSLNNLPSHFQSALAPHQFPTTPPYLDSPRSSPGSSDPAPPLRSIHPSDPAPRTPSLPQAPPPKSPLSSSPAPIPPLPRPSLPLRSADHLSDIPSLLCLFPTWPQLPRERILPHLRSGFVPSCSLPSKLPLSPPPPLLPTRKWIRSHRPQRPRTKWRRGERGGGSWERRDIIRMRPWKARPLPAHVKAEAVG